MQRTPELPRGTDSPKGEDKPQETEELHSRPTASHGIRLRRLSPRESPVAVGWLQHGPTASHGSGAVLICQGHRAGYPHGSPKMTHAPGFTLERDKS